jgi:hypothetical protein
MSLNVVIVLCIVLVLVVLVVLVHPQKKHHLSVFAWDEFHNSFEPDYNFDPIFNVKISKNSFLVRGKEYENAFISVTPIFFLCYMSHPDNAGIIKNFNPKGKLSDNELIFELQGKMLPQLYATLGQGSNKQLLDSLKLDEGFSKTYPDVTIDLSFPRYFNMDVDIELKYTPGSDFAKAVNNEKIVTHVFWYMARHNTIPNLMILYIDKLKHEKLTTGIILNDTTLPNGVRVREGFIGGDYQFHAVNYPLAAVWLDRNLPNIKVHPDVKLRITVTNGRVCIDVWNKNHPLHSAVKNVTLPLTDNTIHSEHDAIAVLNYMEELYPFADPKSTGTTQGLL